MIENSENTKSSGFDSRDADISVHPPKNLQFPRNLEKSSDARDTLEYIYNTIVYIL